MYSVHVDKAFTIKEFQESTKTKNAMCFFGLLSYLVIYTLSFATEYFARLLWKYYWFRWDDTVWQAFNMIKNITTEVTILIFF